MNLLKQLLQVSIKMSRLVWVFSVAKRLGGSFGYFKSRDSFLTIEVVEDMRIVVGGYLKGLGGKVASVF